MSVPKYLSSFLGDNIKIVWPILIYAQVNMNTHFPIFEKKSELGSRVSTMVETLNKYLCNNNKYLCS